MRSKKTFRDAARIAMNTMGGIGFNEFRDMPYAQKQLVIAEVNKTNSQKK